MGRPFAVLAFLLLLTGCSAFDHGLVDETTSIEPADQFLEGVWVAQAVIKDNRVQVDDDDKAYLKITSLPSGLLRVQIVVFGRCDIGRDFVARQVSLAGLRYLQLMSGKKEETLVRLLSYDWTGDQQLLVKAPSDEVLIQAVEQQQLAGEIYREVEGDWTRIFASTLALRDFVMRHPDAFKPFLTLHRASDFPC